LIKAVINVLKLKECETKKRKKGEKKSKLFQCNISSEGVKN